MTSTPQPVNSSIDAMRRRLSHRGPDGEGWSVTDGRLVRAGNGQCVQDAANVGFGHTRLTIIDLTDSGAQPMLLDDGDYCITFNGEIYNYVELKEELQDLGYEFRSTSDTEVLARAYAAWGEAALNRLVGMFAFAIWDRRNRRVVLARDFFGIKPLYYAIANDCLYFASEIKALLDRPGVSSHANSERLYEYLRFGRTDFGDRTMFRDVAQLAAGHVMVVNFDDAVSPEIRPYFDRGLPDLMDISWSEATTTLRDMFLESVDLHLRSDVPVGAALSGGLDSSSLVTAVRRLYPDQEIHSFSFIDRGGDFSEERWVDEVTTAAGATAHKVVPTPTGIADELDELIYFEDEPSANIGIYPQHLVARLAQETGIKVLLSGEGGDELFAGYKTYGAVRLASLLRRGRWARAMKFSRILARLPNRYRPMQEAAQYLIPRSLQEPLRKLLGKELNPPWLDSAWYRENVHEMATEDRRRGSRLLHRELSGAMYATSIPHLLHYQDRASMASSVESRVPFLTPKLVRFAYSLPESFYFNEHGVGKSVFVSAVEEFLPESVVKRQDKYGFDVTTKGWATSLSAVVDKVLQGDTAQRIPALRLDVVKNVWTDVKAGTKPLDRYVWRWINLIRWADIFDVGFDT